jgi:hypothetical protein
MAIGDIYIKYKTDNKTRKELCCLASDLFNYIDEIRITSDIPTYIPKGYYLLQRIYPKPDIPDGKLKGYHFKIDDGVMKRYYLVCDGANDKQLLVVEDYEEAVQNFLDQTVQRKGYDNVYTCLSYKGDPDPIFSQEADEVLVWRSRVWRTAQGILNQWATGQIEQPTINQVIEQLPKLEW